MSPTYPNRSTPATMSSYVVSMVIVIAQTKSEPSLAAVARRDSSAVQALLPCTSADMFGLARARPPSVRLGMKRAICFW